MGASSTTYPARWQSGKTTVIRVPQKIAATLIDIARKLDAAESLVMREENGNLILDFDQTATVPEQDLSRPVNVSSVPQRSPFRYPGGKTWLVPYLRQWLKSKYLKPKRFIEPFAGGAVASLTTAPLLVPDLSPAPVASNPAGEIPYGSRVAGRPGFVYSPFAEKNQLVDVAGIAPGVEVKCPYTNKLFRVPEPLPEEMAPAPANVIPAPPEPAANPDPAPQPGPAPAPPAATPPVSQTPTASWSDKEKNLVQSPFGAAGQLVDVSGRAAGSTMQCPFTNKEFIIPAH